MLTRTDPLAARFEALRAAEFSRLDVEGVAYLDYAGAGLHGRSQARAWAERLEQGVFGNPHSEHAPASLSEAALDFARAATLAHLGADPADYAVCFTANTSAAVKLVAEAHWFDRHHGLVLGADNHNSVNGAREFARAAGAPIYILPLDDELRLDDPAARLEAIARDGAGLLAFPAQSNFSGVRHPLALIDQAQALGFSVLVDAAGLGPGGGLDLGRHPADFVALSFYKLFGLPTGLGALVARHEALARLRRPWFSGGTVDFVSVRLSRHQLSAGHAGFEDGTPDFLSAGAVAPGFDFLDTIGRAAIGPRLQALTAEFLERAGALTHANGAPLVRVYGPGDLDRRGAVVAFNLLDPDGRVVPYAAVEAAAGRAGVALRGGCFCNPGAAEKAFDFPAEATARCLDQLAGSFSNQRFAECLGGDATVGALRVSFGIPTVRRDLDRALEVMEGFAGRRARAPQTASGSTS